MDIKSTIDKLEILSGKKVEYVKELSRGKTFVFKTIARKNEVIQCFLLDTYENLIKHYKNVCMIDKFSEFSVLISLLNVNTYIKNVIFNTYTKQELHADKDLLRVVNDKTKTVEKLMIDRNRNLYSFDVNGYILASKKIDADVLCIDRILGYICMIKKFKMLMYDDKFNFMQTIGMDLIGEG